MNDLEKAVESLIQKAESAKEANDALRFSQAACNVANTLRVLQTISLKETDQEEFEDTFRRSE